MIRKLALLAFGLLVPLVSEAQQPIVSDAFQGQVYYGAPPCPAPPSCPAQFAQLKLNTTAGCYVKFVLQPLPGQKVLFRACSDQLVVSSSECGPSPLTMTSAKGPICAGMSFMMTIGYTTPADFELLAYDPSGRAVSTPIHLDFMGAPPDGGATSGDGSSGPSTQPTYTTDSPSSSGGTYTATKAAAKPQPTSVTAKPVPSAQPVPAK